MTHETDVGESMGPSGPIWLMQPIPYFGEKLADNWVWEPKFDGWRLQVIRYGDGRVECWGRRLERTPNWTERLEQIVSAAEAFLPEGTLLDAELCSDRGRRFIPSLFARVKRASPLVWVFDVVYHRGRFVGDRPLQQRRKFLQQIPWVTPFFLTPQFQATDVDSALSSVVAEGQEGIVLKRLTSPYRVGRVAPEATEDWRKIRS
jgi:ATP-dependent DNA ligase